MLSEFQDQAHSAMAEVSLTPLMVLAAALLFMVKADGDIDDHESSQLQAVIGGNSDLLDWAAEYTQAVSLDDFLVQAPESLQPQDVMCILANLCDSMQSDGQVKDVEWDMFGRIQNAFGITTAAFEPTYKAIKFKNNHTLLGEYSQQDLTSPTPSPHLVLASMLLFMMAADGGISEEEIGQLQSVIGGFEGLQVAAMQEVRKRTLGEFLRVASPTLSNEQKLLIVVNLADSMMSDGSIGTAEQNLFDNIQEEFKVSKSRLSPFLQALKIKNLKPFKTDMDPKAIHARRAQERKQGNWFSSAQAVNTSEAVHRTMDFNIQQVEGGFHDQTDIDLVALHGRQLDREPGFAEGSPDVNLQKVSDRSIPVNLQNLDPDQLSTQVQNLAQPLGLRQNVQDIGNGNLKDNIQGVGNSSLKDNIQSISIANLHNNDQALDDEACGALAREWLDQVRLESLEANISAVHGKLDKVKPTKAWQSLKNLTAQAQTSVLVQEEEAAVGNDQGGIRFRTLLLVLCISFPLVGFAYGFIYPTLSCQGTDHRVQHWYPEGADSKILLDETHPQRQLLQIRRGEINLNNQRFPLYKELNPNNHIAMQTNTGFRGVFSMYGVDQMNYAFELNRAKGELQISTSSSGVRFIDGQSGTMDVVSDFVGRCENRWF